jgi:hypothetical protein
VEENPLGRAARHLLLPLCPLLVQNSLRHALLQPTYQDHRPLQVLGHPELLRPSAAADSLLEGREDPSCDIFPSLPLGDRDSVIIPRLEAQMGQFLPIQRDRLRPRLYRQAAGIGVEGVAVAWCVLRITGTSTTLWLKLGAALRN